MLDLQFAESLRFRCPGDGFGHHFGRLFETRGSLFLVFEGIGRGWNFDGFFMISGGPQIPSPSRVGGNLGGLRSLLSTYNQETADSNQQLENRKLLISN